MNIFATLSVAYVKSVCQCYGSLRYELLEVWCYDGRPLWKQFIYYIKGDMFVCLFICLSVCLLPMAG